MKKVFLTLGMMLMTAGALWHGLVHSMSSSVQLTVDSGKSTATRLGNQYSVSGSNVGTTDGTNSGMLSIYGSITSGVYDPGTITATRNLNFT